MEIRRCPERHRRETDNEIYGTGNAVSYKYRVEETRLGRFLSVDPLSPKYPFYSPYAFSGNKIIAYRELEGLEETRAFLKAQSEALGKTVFEKTNSKFLQNKVIEGGATISTFVSPLEIGVKGLGLTIYQNANFDLPETDPTTLEYWEQNPLFGPYIHLSKQLTSGDRFEETEATINIILVLSPLLSEMAPNVSSGSGGNKLSTINQARTLQIDEVASLKNQVDDIPQVLINNQRGNSFKDRMIERLISSGKYDQVVDEVYLKTIVDGKTIVSIFDGIARKGDQFTLLEMKTGGSPISPNQEAIINAFKAGNEIIPYGKKAKEIFGDLTDKNITPYTKKLDIYHTE
ncbi:MAG: hypothetical protein R3D00_21400 [Bacteroidia bacterium]